MIQIPTRFAFLPAVATVAIVFNWAPHGEAEGAGDAPFVSVVAVADGHGDGTAADAASAGVVLDVAMTIDAKNNKARNIRELLGK